jgi:hypothetical protein
MRNMHNPTIPVLEESALALAVPSIRLLKDVPETGLFDDGQNYAVR